MGTTRRIVPQSLKKSIRVSAFGGILAAALLAAPAIAQTDPTRALAELPGFDFSRLTQAAKKELASVLTDEFDYCGRPLTLLASLKKGDACRHTKRLVGFAATLASEGSPATEIINQLSKYNQGFAKRAALKPDERLCKGSKDAKVTVVEFADFECPACAAARPLIEELAKSRPVRICYAPFPLQSHPHAVLAGQAALFARDQGKFWAMHDALFDNQLSLSEGYIKQLAGKLGLDAAALGKVFAAGKYVDELNASKEQGKAGGVEMTPSLFLNGRKASLPLAADALQLMVDDELDWVAGNNGWPKD